MSIDKQRIAAVAALENLASSIHPTAVGSRRSTAEAASLAELHSASPLKPDAMHGLLVMRADVLMGAPEASNGATELQHITDAVEGYEIRRWPRGKVPGGKG